ncbi:MAG TPA: carboxypeptidase-like regulatory domain-containing protein, partial [Bryobacterales bacterium]|nr:carboxypeptidase-like regulatory domain-containing protein [Bryobacterales bacterium]
MRFLIFLVVAPALAQVTTGSISGYVLDPNRGAIAGAAVVTRDASRGFERRVESDRSGFYVVAELAPAVYEVSASAAGFAESAAREVRVAVNSRERLDITLPLAGRQESVEVRANAGLIQTESSELGEVIDQSRIEELPLNRRDFLQLALLAPGVLPAV